MIRLLVLAPFCHCVVYCCWSGESPHLREPPCRSTAVLHTCRGARTKAALYHPGLNSFSGDNTKLSLHFGWNAAVIITVVLKMLNIVSIALYRQLLAWQVCSSESFSMLGHLLRQLFHNIFWKPWCANVVPFSPAEHLLLQLWIISLIYFCSWRRTETSPRLRPPALNLRRSCDPPLIASSCRASLELSCIFNSKSAQLKLFSLSVL